MKTRTTIVLCCLSALLVLGIGHRGSAQLNSAAPWNRIGVVSVMKVMQLSKKNTDYQRKVTAEMNTRRTELQKMVQELQTDEASLQTMRQGSEDHIAHFKGMVLKQSELEALEKFYHQTGEARNLEWTEKMYQEILTAAGDVAKELGLNMVFERSEPEFPMKNEQFVLAVSSHKLIYYQGLVDITDQVIDKIDN